MEDTINLIAKNISSATNEAQTKNFLITPFLKFLGYDITSPNQVASEYCADIGNKKGEKVDFAIFDTQKEPIILIECKHHSEDLKKHRDQLRNYFNHLSPRTKFGILTNGINYEFYASLDTINKMDEEPFLKFNIHNISPKVKDILELFRQSKIMINEILEVARKEKNSAKFNSVLANEFKDPSDELIKYFAKQIYNGIMTQTKIEEFKIVFKKELNEYIINRANLKAKQGKQEENSKIITTDRELKFYALLHGILISSDIDPEHDITFKDTEQYFGIFYKRKHLLRFYDSKKNTYIKIPALEYKRIDLKELKDIFDYSGEILEALKILQLK